MPGLGFVILYTRDVARKMAFYERAFGMKRKYLAEKEVFGEMEGEVPLQFVREDFVKTEVQDFVPSRPDRSPAAIELGFLLKDVPAAYARAMEAGCISVSAPQKKPWGSVVAFVRDDEGVLVELCSPRAAS